MEDMPKPAYVVQRAGSRNLYYRRRYPDDVAAHLGQAVYNKSLKTSSWHEAAEAALDHARDYVLAVKAARREIADGKESIQRQAAETGKGPAIWSRSPILLRPVDPALPELTELAARQLASQYLWAQMSALDAASVDGGMDADRRAEYVIEVEDRIAALRDPDDLVTLRLTQSLENGLLIEAGLRADFCSHEAQLLRELLRRAALQVARIERRHLDGDYSAQIEDAAFLRHPDPVPVAVHALETRVRPTFSDVQDAYLTRLFSAGQAEKTKDRYRAEMKHIVAFFGAATELASLTKAQCEEFAGVIGKLPPNFEDRIRAGDDLRSIAQHNDGVVLSYATQEKYLGQLSRFCEWANGHDYLRKNYANGLTPAGKKPDGSEAKMPFEDAELRRIFSRPIYTGCRNDEHGFSAPGPEIIRRSRYWAPLIALFSGLRCGEILQLTGKHFRTSPAGNPFIVLTKDMKLKNANAEREIPVHPFLADVGLLDWVSRKKDASERLFPEVPFDKYDNTSSNFAKRYRSDLKHFNLGGRRKLLSFHSFRHTFKRALDRADVPENKKEEICGWTRGKRTSRRYGTGLEADVLAEAVGKVRYNLDLSHLVKHAALED